MYKLSQVRLDLSTEISRCHSFLQNLEIPCLSPPSTYVASIISGAGRSDKSTARHRVSFGTKIMNGPRANMHWVGDDTGRKAGSQHPPRHNGRLGPRDSHRNGYRDGISVARAPPNQINSTKLQSKFGSAMVVGTETELMSLGGSVRNHKFGPDYYIDNRHQEFKVGDVISTVWHAPSLDSRAKFDGGHVTFSWITGAISAKMRPAVIIAKWESHALAVTVFSHGGRGPPPSTRNDNLALRNERSIADAVDARECLVMIDSKGKWRVSPNSTVYISKPQTLEWAYPIKLLGKLDEDSCKLLQTRSAALLKIGALSLRDQGAEFDRLDRRDKGQSRSSYGPGPSRNDHNHSRRG